MSTIVLSFGVTEGKTSKSKELLKTAELPKTVGVGVVSWTSARAGRHDQSLQWKLVLELRT